MTAADHAPAGEAATGAECFRFRVDASFFTTLPDACFGLVLCQGLDNRVPGEGVAAALDAAVATCAHELEGVPVKETAPVAPYRDAFRALGINPNKYPCSIEALLTRIAKGKGMPHINTAVDLGNTVSIRHRLPIGAHDVASTDGELAVRPALAGDRFVPFGSTDAEQVGEGEVVYAAGRSVRTRRWTWRQSEDGRITEATTDVFFPIDGFQQVNGDAVRAAQADLAAALVALGARVRLGWVDAAHPEASFA